MLGNTTKILGLCVLAAACSKSTPATDAHAGALDGGGVAAPGPNAGGAEGFRASAPAVDGVDPAPLDPVIHLDADSHDVGDAGEQLDDDGGVALSLTGPNTILVIVDRSGSMAAPWEGGTRWTAGNDAVVAALLPFREDLTLAALQFPLPDGCDVPELDTPGQYPFTSGEQFLGEWSERYPSAVPTGSTPLEAALAAADRAIDAAIAAGLFEHKFKVMLITDGEPTCSDDPARMLAYPARWTELGIRTYVLGLPGSAPAQELLQSLAEAGSTGTYRQIGDPGQLEHDIGFAAAE